jgi:hypothetical protein
MKYRFVSTINRCERDDQQQLPLQQKYVVMSNVILRNYA